MQAASDNSRPRWAVAALAVLVTLQFALGLVAAHRNSATFDECAYVPAGVTYWKLGDHRLSDDHPLLMKYVLGAPVALADPSVPTDRAWGSADQWQYGTRFLVANAERFHALVVLARLPVMLLSVGTTLIVFFWARRLWGPWVAVAAAAMCVFEPNLLAHGSLATLDTGLTFFMLLAVWQWSLLGRTPGRGRGVARALLVGLAFGWAITTKQSGLMLGPILLAWGIVRIVRAGGEEGGTRRDAVIRLVLVLAVGWLWVNTLGGFRGTFRPLSSYPAESFCSELMRSIRSGPKGALPAMVPERYWRALDEQWRHSREGHGVYVAGRMHESGVWYYYAYTLALKTPPALQALLLLGVVAWFIGRPVSRSRGWDVGAVGLAAVLLTVGSTSHLQIGVRFLLPAVPLAALLAGRGIALLSRRRWGAALAVALVLIGAADSLRHWPNMLGYLSPYVGRPDRPWRYLADSNVDWGQGLIRLSDYLASQPDGPLYLAYWGRAQPDVYGLPEWQLPGPGARPGRYVVSVNYLAGITRSFWHKRQGRWEQLEIGRDADGPYYCAPLLEANRDQRYSLDWLLRDREPDAYLGYGLVVYHVKGSGSPDAGNR